MGQPPRANEVPTVKRDRLYIRRVVDPVRVRPETSHYVWFTTCRSFRARWIPEPPGRVPVSVRCGLRNIHRDELRVNTKLGQRWPLNGRKRGHERRLSHRLVFQHKIEISRYNLEVLPWPAAAFLHAHPPYSKPSILDLFSQPFRELEEPEFNDGPPEVFPDSDRRCPSETESLPRPGQCPHTTPHTSL